MERYRLRYTLICEIAVVSQFVSTVSERYRLRESSQLYLLVQYLSERYRLRERSQLYLLVQ